MSVKTFTAATMIFSAISTFASASEEAAPAVSTPNLKLDVMAGALGGGPAILGGMTATAPLGHDFGVQVDAAIGSADRDMRGGIAGHFFYRDPRSMLLGITGMWSRIAGPHESSRSDVRRAGVEAEFYLDEVSILPSAGVQNNHGDSTGYAGLGAIYYATPNLAFGASLSGFANSRAVQTGFEYRPASSTNLSYLFDMGVGNEGPPFVMASIRLAIGAPSKTIQERDRYDDPGNIVTYMNTVAAAGIASMSSHRPVPATVTSGGGGGGGGVC